MKIQNAINLKYRLLKQSQYLNVIKILVEIASQIFIKLNLQSTRDANRIYFTVLHTEF